MPSQPITLNSKKAHKTNPQKQRVRETSRGHLALISLGDTVAHKKLIKNSRQTKTKRLYIE